MLFKSESGGDGITVKCHVQAILDETGIDAVIVDASWWGAGAEEWNGADQILMWYRSAGEFHNLSEFYENIPMVEKMLGVFPSITLSATDTVISFVIPWEIM